MWCPSFRHHSVQPSKEATCYSASKIGRSILGSFWLMLALTLSGATQDIYPSYVKPSTSPSRYQQGAGISEPTTVITVPQFPAFSNCPLGCASTSAGASEARSDLLDKRGPQFQPFYSLSSLALMGFCRGGWPIAIDYVLEQDSLLLVVISPEGQSPLIYRLDGKKGHWITKIQIPPFVGNQLRSTWCRHWITTWASCCRPPMYISSVSRQDTKPWALSVLTR